MISSTAKHFAIGLILGLTVSPNTVSEKQSNMAITGALFFSAIGNEGLGYALNNLVPTLLGFALGNQLREHPALSYP